MAAWRFRTAVAGADEPVRDGGLVSGIPLRLAVVAGGGLLIGGCGGESYVVAKSKSQLMVVDRIDREGAEPTARLTFIASRPDPAQIAGGLIRRLSFDVRFKCAEGALRYGASVARLETGDMISSPEGGAAWERPAPESDKGKAVKVVCDPVRSGVRREARTLSSLEREYRARVRR